LNEDEIGIMTSMSLKTQDKEDGPEKVLPFVVMAACLVRSEDAAPKSRVRPVPSNYGLVLIICLVDGVRILQGEC